jgi:hypothetical protein
MKKLFLSLLLTFCACAVFAQVEIDGCRAILHHGQVTISFVLSGRVRVVTNPKEYADFDIRVTTNPREANFFVRKVQSPPFECCLWQFVRSGEDFTVRFVKELEDFTVMFVSSGHSVGYKRH